MHGNYRKMQRKCREMKAKCKGMLPYATEMYGNARQIAGKCKENREKWKGNGFEMHGNGKVSSQKAHFWVPSQAENSLSPIKSAHWGPTRPWYKKKKPVSLSNTAIHNLGIVPMSTRHHRKKIIFSVQKVKIFTPKKYIFGRPPPTENLLSPPKAPPTGPQGPGAKF